MVANAQEFWQVNEAVEEQRGREEMPVSGSEQVYRTRDLGHGVQAGSSCLASGVSGASQIDCGQSCTGQS
jgi:hypothetical protein